MNNIKVSTLKRSSKFTHLIHQNQYQNPKGTCNNKPIFFPLIMTLTLTYKTKSSQAKHVDTIVFSLLLLAFTFKVVLNCLFLQGLFGFLLCYKLFILFIIFFFRIIFITFKLMMIRFLSFSQQKNWKPDKFLQIVCHHILQMALNSAHFILVLFFCTVIVRAITNLSFTCDTFREMQRTGNLGDWRGAVSASFLQPAQGSLPVGVRLPHFVSTWVLWIYKRPFQK